MKKKLIWIVVIFALFFIMSQQPKQMKKLAGELSTRSFSGNVYTNQDTTVSIQVNPGTSTYYLIDEKYPSGWTVKSASDSGDYATKSGHIFWSVMSGATSKTYTYVINPNVNTGTQTFTGTIGFEFQSEGLIGGTSSVTVTSPSCTSDSQCASSNECQTGSCVSGNCQYNNKPDGTTCSIGNCQSGTCTVIPTYSCIGTAPSNSQICSGDNTGLTTNTPIILVDYCGTPKCEYTCSSGYTKSGTSCISSCTPNWSCGSWSPCSNGAQARTCTDNNNCGVTTGKPAESQSCTISCTPSWQTGAWSTCSSGTQTRTVTDSNNCGATTGKPAESQSCVLTEDDCEIYEKFKSGKCEVAGWVYLIGGFFILISFMGAINK